MKKLITLIFAALMALACSDEPSFEKPSGNVVQIEHELTYKDVALGDSSTVYHNPETNTYYTNCRASGYVMLEMPDGTESAYILTTCDVICGYFWCGTVTF